MALDDHWFSPPEKEWGFIVSLHHIKKQDGPHNDDNFCSGSIISSHFVITAAHCVKKYTPNNINKDKLTFKTIEEYFENQNDDLMKGLTIISNSKYSRLGKSPMQNVHHVEEIMIHPKYVSTWKKSSFYKMIVTLANT